MHKYLAHSANSSGWPESLHDHLQAVAERAGEFAESFGAAKEAQFAGLLHDIGKFGERFQQRLAGKEHGIDHWSAGAWLALTEKRHLGIASALAIQGHHIGLQCREPQALKSLEPQKLELTCPQGLRQSEPSANTLALTERFQQDGLVLPEFSESLLIRNSGSVAEMLDVRMLFSALVDADFLETEAHFQGDAAQPRRYRECGPALDAQPALGCLLSHLAGLSAQASGKAPERVNQLRQDLLGACLQAAEAESGTFTLTAPTGTGKTFSMLAFALKHAAKHGLRRVVTVIPYLSIIEQTAGEYRKALSQWYPPDRCGEYILEHHSMAGTRKPGSENKNEEQDEEDEGRRRARQLSENWDAPIIVTTSVQFLESLFANRPGACRKLHRLAKSVVLLDEVQTLPLGLAIPTLAALSRLSERFGASIVFSTATQPAFKELNDPVRRYCARGWSPQEIVPPALRLFERARRTKVIWPERGVKTTWQAIAERLAETEQALCIVNLKRHARDLYERLEAYRADDLFHLSTAMCPAHRNKKLQEVRERLDERRPCVLISTQCVEAGVDVDFPVVFRAMGPLDSIAQAAGRCNRNGRAAVADVHVFVPDEDPGSSYPSGAYKQAASVTELLLAGRGAAGADINDPAIYDAYFKELYSLSRPECHKEELLDAIARGDFVEVSRQYRIIDTAALDVLMPYDVETYNKLADELRAHGLTKAWMARARPWSIGLYRPKEGAPVWSYLDPARVFGRAMSEEWFVYLKREHYHPVMGFVSPAAHQLMEG